MQIYTTWRNNFELNLGTSTSLNIETIAKKFPSIFWSEAMRTIKPLMLEYLTNSPEKNH